MRMIRAARLYRGSVITHCREPGKLPWAAYTGGTFVCADTLEGIKRLIRMELAT